MSRGDHARRWRPASSIAQPMGGVARRPGCKGQRERFPQTTCTGCQKRQPPFLVFSRDAEQAEHGWVKHTTQGCAVPGCRRACSRRETGGGRETMPRMTPPHRSTDRPADHVLSARSPRRGESLRPRSVRVRRRSYPHSADRHRRARPAARRSRPGHVPPRRCCLPCPTIPCGAPLASSKRFVRRSRGAPTR